MKYTTLGKTGFQVSRIGFGGLHFGSRHLASNWDPYTPEGKEQVLRTIHAGFERGINFIDTSSDYGDGHSERLTGLAIKGRREQTLVFTKYNFFRNMRPSDIRQACEDSLRRLDTDSIDLFQMHGGNYDDAFSKKLLTEGYVDELESLREEGKIRAIGFTVNDDWSARMLIESGRYDCGQFQYNIISQRGGDFILDAARTKKMGTMSMRPLTAGMLPRILDIIAPEIAATTNIAELSLRFCLADSRIDCIPVGMRWESEVEQNCMLIDRFEPTADIADIPRTCNSLYRADDAKIQPSPDAVTQSATPT